MEFNDDAFQIIRWLSGVPPLGGLYCFRGTSVEKPAREDGTCMVENPEKHSVKQRSAY